jgi:hypothetical protein
MKLSTLTAAAMLAAATQSAAAAEPWSRPEREGAMMLYFSKSFGSEQARDRSPLAFGLRFQQQGLLNDIGPVTLLDARYSLGGRRQMLVAGLDAFGGASSDESSSASNDMSREHPGWTAAAVVAAVLALWCAAECGSDDDDPEYTPGTG